MCVCVSVCVSYIIMPFKLAAQRNEAMRRAIVDETPYDNNQVFYGEIVDIESDENLVNDGAPSETNSQPTAIFMNNSDGDQSAACLNAAFVGNKDGSTVVDGDSESIRETDILDDDTGKLLHSSLMGRKNTHK